MKKPYEKPELRVRPRLTRRETIFILRSVAMDYEARASRAVAQHPMGAWNLLYTMKSALWYAQAALELRAAIAANDCKL